VSDIFISYAIEDLDRIKPLVKALEEVGWSVWWDRSMLPGSRWQRVLRDAIKAAKCIMVAWSESSINSEWVEVEAEEGRRRGILVPVLIDDVAPPFPFGGFQAARLVEWTGSITNLDFHNLQRALSNVLSGAEDAQKRAAEPHGIWRPAAEAEDRKVSADPQLPEQSATPHMSIQGGEKSPGPRVGPRRKRDHPASSKHTSDTTRDHGDDQSVQAHDSPEDIDALRRQLELTQAVFGGLAYRDAAKAAKVAASSGAPLANSSEQSRSSVPSDSRSRSDESGFAAIIRVTFAILIALLTVYVGWIILLALGLR
jgi:hypothetical protein